MKDTPARAAILDAPPAAVLDAATRHLRSIQDVACTFFEIRSCEVGWLFRYNSEQLIKHGDRMAFLWGCPPFVVTSRDLAIHTLHILNQDSSLRSIVDRYKSGP